MNQELRQEVRKRDDHECKFCEDTENLHTHHIVPRSAGGSDKKENLMTVCASCHSKIENSQGAALKRIKKDVREEETKDLENKVERLEEELEDKYSFEEIVKASEKRIFNTTLYVLQTPVIGSDRMKVERTTPSREEAIESLEDCNNAELKKWSVGVKLGEIIKSNESKIAKTIESLKRRDEI